MTKMKEQRDFVLWKLLAPLDVERAAANLAFSLYSSESEATSKTREYIDGLRMDVARGIVRGDPDKKRQYGMLVSDRVSDCVVRFVFPKSSSEKNTRFPMVKKSWHETHGCLIDKDARAQMATGNFRMREIRVRNFMSLGPKNPTPKQQCQLSPKDEVESLAAFLKTNFPGLHLCLAKGEK